MSYQTGAKRDKVSPLMSILSHNLGYPRVGPRRELKLAIEAYWKKSLSRAELDERVTALRRERWTTQRDLGIDLIPSNDFSLYDQMLDTLVLVGAVPERFGKSEVDLDTYFLLARGDAGGCGCGGDHGEAGQAMEMTKWFDTNYHYIVPELHENQGFRVASTKPFDEFSEALSLGIRTKPVLVGPVTFLSLAKAARNSGPFDTLSLLDRLVPVYAEVLRRLADLGAEVVQLDEPVLALDLNDTQRAALTRAYEELRKAAPGLKLLVATYFGELRENLPTLLSLPVDIIHIDATRAAGEVDTVVGNLPSEKTLSIGIVDGRNIWKNDFKKSLAVLEKAKAKLGADRLWIAPSCSLLHSPVTLASETKLDEELKNWLAFANEKLSEVVTLTRALKGEEVAGELAANEAAQQSRRESPRIHKPEVKARLAAVRKEDAERHSVFAERQKVQRERLKLPAFPTTTIGSFPQTHEIRSARARWKKGTLSNEDYEAFLEAKIAESVRYQEDLDIDVPVHGEFERNDMVEYFGEQLDGFAFTAFGWVQSYGTRCVKPPIIFGDVSRPHPMTIRWSTYAQSLTKRPMKGMLTGPVTVLQWSFVRDDQPRAETARQIALALRDEVVDLEAAGIGVIQIDEPALREGLPLRRADWEAYLRSAVNAFGLSAAGVRDETQIHTHMCYSEFNDIIEAIAALDADVISIETSRSNMELLGAFATFEYPQEIGPGVWDIHSPRVPPTEEMIALLRKAKAVLPPENLWVNPDCGLKTRGWEETLAALRNMVAAARRLREETAAVS